MEEISVLRLVATTLAASKPPPREASLFNPVLMPRYVGWRGLFLSICLHLFVIFFVLPLTYLLPESEAREWRRHARTFEPLRLEIPDRLYLSSVKPAPRENPPAPAREQLRRPLELAKREPPPAAKREAEAIRAAARKFRLPRVTLKPLAAQTLIQPDLPPDLPLKEQVKLPDLYLTAPVLPRLAPRRFVAPGASAPADITPRKPDALPELAMPADIQADIQVASMRAGPEKALLRLPRPTIPFERFRPLAASSGGSASGRGSSISPTLGEPINVLAYSADPAALADKVTIPLGNQIGRLPGPPPSADPAAPVGIPVAGAGTAAASGGNGKQGNPGGEGNSSGTGAGGRGGRDGGASVGTAAGNMMLSAVTPVRIEHPSNAVFDVVVSQASVDEAFPESAGVLSGRPVYTVYLQVGAPKSWLMQFAIPKGVDDNPRVVEGVVYIGRSVPLKAPFPLVTVLPPVTTRPRSSYIMVHGFVDTTGNFKDLTVLRAPEERIGELLLPQLAQWHFRPATRDGVPVLVEILLAIPPHQG